VAAWRSPNASRPGARSICGRRAGRRGGEELMAHRRLGRPGGGRFKCAAVSRADRLESDALVMAQERAPIDDLGCVGDFDGVPELVPDERELLPLVLAGSDADHEVTTSAGVREEQQPRLWLAARSDSAQIVLEVHDQ